MIPLCLPNTNNMCLLGWRTHQKEFEEEACTVVQAYLGSTERLETGPHTSRGTTPSTSHRTASC
jgi:hypothetical protein